MLCYRAEMRHKLSLLPDVMQEIQSLAREHNIPMAHVLRAGGVPRWTWQRWMMGQTQPQYNRVRDVQLALIATLAHKDS